MALSTAMADILFDMPDGPQPLLYEETVMIHTCGLLLCGHNKYVRHWLDVFLRDKLPMRSAVALNYDQEFLLHMHASGWSRTFQLTDANQLDWRDPSSSRRASVSQSSQGQFTEAEVPHFEASTSSLVNTDAWLLQMVHPCMKEVSQGLQVLSEEHALASSGSDQASKDALAVIQGRTLAASITADNLLHQWEAVIEPPNVPGLGEVDVEGPQFQEL